MAIESTRNIYSGRLIAVSVKDTILPNGVPMSVESVQHPGAAAVVALDDSGNVIMIKQFRPVIGEYVLELPAGKLEAHEEVAQTARRELQEETGYEAQILKPIGNILSAPGYSTERVALFLAQKLVLSHDELEKHELLSVMLMPFHKALEMIKSGEISDAKTVAGLLLAKELA